MTVLIREENPPQHTVLCAVHALKRDKAECCQRASVLRLLAWAELRALLRMETGICECKECDFPHSLEERCIAPVRSVYVKDWQKKSQSSKAGIFFFVPNRHLGNMKVLDGSQTDSEGTEHRRVCAVYRRNVKALSTI